MTKPIPTTQTADTISRVLALLAETPVALEALTRGRTEAELRAPLGPGERSAAEIVDHLINTEARTHEAIVLALTLKEPLLPAVHPERDVGKLLRPDRLPPADALTYFRLRRAVLLPVLVELSDAQWARTVQQAGKQRRESVYWLARALALHEQEHVVELRRGWAAGQPDA